MQPYPRFPDLVGPGHLHGTGCLSARAVGTGFPTVVRRFCFGLGCGWVWVLLTPPFLARVLGGCVWARFVVLSLFCQLFVLFVVGLGFRSAYGTCVVLCALRLPPAVSSFGVRCGLACWARVTAVPRPSWLGCRGVFFALFFSWIGFVVSVAGCPRPGPCGSCPPIPFLSGWAAGSFFFLWCVSACFGVPFPGGPLFLAWCCRFWLGGPPVPLWWSCLWCLLGWGVWPPLVVLASGLVAVGCFRPPPLPPCFFLGGGLPVPPSAFPGLAHALARHSMWSPGLLLAVAFCLAMFWPHGSGGLCTRWARRPFLPGLAAACGSGLGALGCSCPFSSAVPVSNLLGGPPPLLPGARWPRVWPAVPVCGVLVRRLLGCAVACFG